MAAEIGPANGAAGAAGAGTTGGVGPAAAEDDVARATVDAPAYYPIFLDLRGRLALVVGGEEMALEKVRGLLAVGARVRLVARNPIPELAALTGAVSARIEHRRRGYRRRDLRGVSVVVCERGDERLERRVFRQAARRGIPVNVVDRPERCTFLAPAILRRGDLAVAVSTGGRAPALAVRLRQELERRLGAEYGRFLELAGGLRSPLARRVPAFEERRRIWYELVDSEVLDLLRQGDDAAAHRRIHEITGVWPEGAARAPGSGPAKEAP